MTTSDFDELFKAALESRAVAFTRTENDLYELDIENGPIIVSTENVRRNFLRDQDASAIDRFIERTMLACAPLPDWSAMSSRLYPMMDSAEIERSPGDLIRKLSDATVSVLTYYNEDVGLLRALSGFDLQAAGIDEDTAWKTATSNLDRLMRETKLSFTEAADAQLGMLEANEPHKASLLQSREIKEKVVEILGWPVYAVAPARDFVYLFSRDGGLINSIGHVVVREFLGSGYPISTEVWELSDSGLEAIGAFPTS